MDESRHDADLAGPRRDDAGTVGPDEPAICFVQHSLDLDHVQHGDAFGNAYRQLHAAGGGFKYRVGGKCRGYVDHADPRAGGVHGLRHGIVDRHAKAPLAAPPRRHSGNHPSAVFHALFRVKRALPPGHALTDDFRFRADENTHDTSPRGQADGLPGCAREIRGGHDIQPALSQQPPALLDVGTLQAHHHGHGYADVLDRRGDAFGDQVAAHDTAEDVHQNRLHVGVGENDPERPRDALRRGAAAHVEEIGRLAPVELDDIHGRHREAGAVHHAGDIAVQRDVIEAMGARLALVAVFLRFIPPGRQTPLAEQRAVLDIDLGVQGDQAAAGIDDQRIDFHQARIAFVEERQELLKNVLELPYPVHVQTQPETQLTALVSGYAGCRMNRRGKNFFRRRRGNLLDIHPARRRGHDYHPLPGPVHQGAEIQLPPDTRGGFDIDRIHRQPGRAALAGRQTGTQQRGGEFGNFVRRLRQLHSARLAPPARVHLRLDDPAAATRIPHGRCRFIGRRRRAATGHGNSKLGEQRLGLILVKIHRDPLNRGEPYCR